MLSDNPIKTVGTGAFTIAKVNLFMWVELGIFISIAVLDIAI